MRILVAGDMHFDKEHFEWIRNRQFDFACICLTGDYLDITKGDFYTQVEWVQDWVRSLKVPVFICSGNHDLDDFGESDWLLDLSSSSVHVDGSIAEIQGIKFGVVPYLGAFWSDFSDCDVLITHVPPANTNTSKNVNGVVVKDWGDEELYLQLSEKILMPKYVFCGHVENPLGHKDLIHKTVIINPGNQSQVVEIADVKFNREYG